MAILMYNTRCQSSLLAELGQGADTHMDNIQTAQDRARLSTTVAGSEQDSAWQQVCPRN